MCDDDYINDLRTIQTDIVVVCSDGETSAVKSLLTSRSAYMRNIMKVEDSGIIKFPTKRLAVIQYIINYLQYNDKPNCKTVDEWFDLIIASDEFKLDNLKKYGLMELMMMAGDPKYSLYIYNGSNIDIFEKIRIKSFETSVKYSKMVKNEYICDKCKKVSDQLLWCNTYGCPHSRASTATKCAMGHKLVLNASIKCGATLANGTSCTGSLVLERTGLHTENVSCEDLAAMYKLYLASLFDI